MFQIIEALSSVPVPELALRLYLECAEVHEFILKTCVRLWTLLKKYGFTDMSFVAQAANDSDLEPVAYEFFTQAYILYEEEISVVFTYPIFTLLWSLFSGLPGISIYLHCSLHFMHCFV